jgi:hypothetical protein
VPGLRSQLPPRPFGNRHLSYRYRQCYIATISGWLSVLSLVAVSLVGGGVRKRQSHFAGVLSFVGGSLLEWARIRDCQMPYVTILAERSDGLGER